MSNGKLPDYLSMAKPNPLENRTPWYKSTAPVYAGIFLWIAFYRDIAIGTLDQAGLPLALLGLVFAALICHYLFYLVPGLFGMKTGYPLYVVGSSTYGTQGGFLMPGLLMGLLQFGWLAVNIALATTFILKAFGVDEAPKTLAFAAVAIVWAALAVFVALKGIQYIGKVSTYLPIVPLVMILIVFFTNVGDAFDFEPAPDAKPMVGFLAIIGIVVGFFATAGAAGVDFGMGNRNAKDIQMGGLTGIALAILIAGGLPLIAVAGANAKRQKEVVPNQLTVASNIIEDAGKAADDAKQDVEKAAGDVKKDVEEAVEKANPLKFDAAIETQESLASIMFILFAIASFAPACFSSFIAGNSIGTMFPTVSKPLMVCIGAVVSIFLAVMGWALDLAGVFGIIGASFGPICGSMAADYLLSGRKWAGPRKGVNLAGYIAWAIGFVVAILPTISSDKFGFINPAPVIGFVIGFVLYAVLAKAGLEPPTVEMTAAQPAPEKHAPVAGESND